MASDYPTAALTDDLATRAGQRPTSADRQLNVALQPAGYRVELIDRGGD